MEKLSRVKKYENLRKQIDMNTNDEAVNMNRVDPIIFKKLDIQEETPRREKEITVRKPNESDTFVNEYMDDLIRDVKQYNRDKGLLQSDITELDILNQLKNPTRLRREDYVKTIEEEPKVDENTIIQSKKEIALQIQELLKEENNSGMNVSKVEAIEEKNNESSTIEMNKTIEVFDEKINDEEIQRLNEQTQQMKIVIEKHEEEMNEISEGIDKTNKLLNILLVILVIALFAVIGFTIYMIWSSK